MLHNNRRTVVFVDTRETKYDVTAGSNNKRTIGYALHCLCTAAKVTSNRILYSKHLTPNDNNLSYITCTFFDTLARELIPKKGDHQVS